jgi:hypothetical protein
MRLVLVKDASRGFCQASSPIYVYIYMYMYYIYIYMYRCDTTLFRCDTTLFWCDAALVGAKKVWYRTEKVWYRIDIYIYIYNTDTYTYTYIGLDAGIKFSKVRNTVTLSSKYTRELTSEITCQRASTRWRPSSTAPRHQRPSSLI